MNETLYGELAIVGFNGTRKFSDRDPRRQSKIALYKRPVANGVRPGPVNRVLEPGDSCAVRSHSRHSVSYTLSRHETVVVEYIPDPKTDMFQIGRSTNSHIDFVVQEPRPSGSSRKRHDRRATVPQKPVDASTVPDAIPTNGKPLQDCPSPPESAVSRFACRIHIDREPPHTARIYAAGFDAAKNIVLGELAVKWRSQGHMDGLTTNGVMVFHADPDSITSDSLHDNDNDQLTAQAHWREVSIGGVLYEMRDKRCIPTMENRVDEDNVLRDKTLIDLCGVTLFWRSASSLSQTANTDDLRMMIDGLNLARFQCPIMYRTLRLSLSVFPSKSNNSLFADDAPSQTETPSEPYVYLNCGHVHGWHTWVGEANKDTVDRTCPLCLQPSPFVPLRMGLEPAFYIDRALATHCFNPCGHMASEKTVVYWCSVSLPNMHNFELRPRCPFCLTLIDSKPVRLRFQGDTDADTLVQLLNAVLTANSSPPELMPLPSLEQPVMSAKY
ncbi:E3 ubiquitin-protein ligase pellino 1 [Clonorchis sinensis]|uniref:E3 ubiquitin-protein ligase pellino 1 n=1 Tax=Clonorchis sinensis TaxID=79923 RepID=A0A8T1MUV1_CLOSI|nr:E3 ubiquitin-protein ligase pellino 1 [Clonorchis sinensis]